MQWQISLDGAGWEADYFLSEAQYMAWSSRSRNLHNMLRSCAQRNGFITGGAAPGAINGTVPGCDRTFLLENGLIDDPFYARNLEHSSWAEKYSWAFRKSFEVPASWQGNRVRIDFKGLDYEVVIFVNGIWIGSHKGMFVPYSCDITDFVKFGERNLLALVFFPAPQGTPNHQDHDPADFAKYHRTQIGFGWDWSRGIVPTGIWDSVTLSCYAETLLTDWHWCFDGENGAVELALDSRFGGEAAVELELTPFNFEGSSSTAKHSFAVTPGANEVKIAMPLPENYRLWEPNGTGFPALYTLKITLDGVVTAAQIGLRTVTMSRNVDSPAGAYDLTFNINGKPVFVRGANYVPQDLLNSRSSAADYDHLVELAKFAGYNMFRIWGGGVIEKEAFYAACDRHGIMVWQEFMHACSNAPKDEEFLAFKDRESRAIVKRLRNHPALTLMCGGNEMQYYGEIPDSPMLKNYQAVCAEMVPELPFHISSPDLSRPGERNHGPWNYMPHAFYNTHFRQLASEVGCNALPEYSSLCRFIPAKELQAMQGPALEYHFYNRVNVYDLAKPLDGFEFDGMEKFCQASMFAQADAAGYMMEHYRRLFPRASGCFFWQYNEPWPTCSWSVVDYYGVPKMALYAMKRANAPVLLSLQDDSWQCAGGALQAQWFITCDREFSGTAALKAVSGNGEVLFTREVSGTWKTGTVQLGEINEKLPQGIVIVFFTLNGESAGCRIYGVPDHKQAFALPPARVTAAVNNGKIVLTNTGNIPALKVKIAFAGAADKSYRLEDNYISLAPGEHREIGFTGEIGNAPVQISAWNIGQEG